MRFLPHLAVALLAAATLPAQAAFVPFGHGCNGGTQSFCIAQNDQNPVLTQRSLPNEYAYAVLNTTAAPLEVVGFELFVESVSLAPATIQTGLYFDAAGPTATAHTNPLTSANSLGTMDVAGPPAWYRTYVNPPVTIAPGAAFWISADTNAVRPPDSSNGSPGPAASKWRRPPFGTTAWATTGIIQNPTFRIVCYSGQGPVPYLTNTGLPVLGQSYSLDLKRGVPGTFAFMITGLNDTMWAAFPLPYELSPFGAPECWNFTSSDVAVLAILDGNGEGSHSLAVPNNPNLSGLTLFHQAAPFTFNNVLGLAPTNAARATAGL